MHAQDKFADQAAGSLAIAATDSGGEGSPLLLIHGFSDTGHSFSLLAPHLAGRRLVTADLPGHGASPMAEGPWRLGACALAMAGLIETLRLQRPVLVGHSLGAMVAVEIAARRPELVGGLALLAGAIRPAIMPDHAMAAGVRGLRDPIAPNDPFFGYWHACRSDVPRDFLAALAQDAASMPASRWRAILDELGRIDLTASAARIRADTLLICGANDPLFGEPHRRDLCAAFPQATCLRLEGCGHNPHWEEPALVADAIARRFPPVIAA